MSFSGTHTPLKPSGEGKCQVRMERNARTGMMSYVLSDEQRDLLTKLYPKRTNEELMKLFGISASTLSRLRRRLGLSKDMTIIRKQVGKKIKETCERNGYYDSLRGRPPSEASIEATKRKRADGFNPILEFRQRHPKRYREMCRRMSDERKRVMQKERQRVDWGLPQHTKLHVPFVLFSRHQVSLRFGMKKRGYLLGNARGSDRMTIYYTEETKRSALIEQHAVAAHFTIKEYKP